MKVLADLWPYLVVIGGALTPFFIWLGRRIDAQDKAREKHEERRTVAAEQIPVAISTISQAMHTRIDELEETVLGAIEGKNVQEIKQAIRESRPDTGARYNLVDMTRGIKPR